MTAPPEPDRTYTEPQLPAGIDIADTPPVVQSANARDKAARQEKRADLWDDALCALMSGGRHEILDKLKEYMERPDPREPTRDELANIEFEQAGSSIRWRTRRLINAGEPADGRCIHGTYLSGECGTCNRESVDAGV